MTFLRPLLTALVGTALLLGSAPPTTAVPAVDDYAEYDGQSTCASEVLPGTDYLLTHLVRTHPGTGYVSTLRPCTSGRSEHKDGRALDWGVDAADPAQKALADAWLDEILATDARGNTHALARRMGIMYVIWDDHIYRAYDGFVKDDYRACERLSNCSKTARHRDHVHVSLSRSGAAAQTSFYRSRNVASVPVLYPGTARLDHEGTALVTLEVPATGQTVVSDFKLSRGVTYRVVSDGLYRSGAGSRVADAACRWRNGGWEPHGMLLVDGTSPWAAECSGGHTYSASYTPAETDFLRLRVDESTPRDSDGTLTFAILRDDLGTGAVAERRRTGTAEPRPARRPGKHARPLREERLTVPAASPRGVLTDRSLRRSGRYRVVVTGTATSGATSFDGRCVTYAGRLRPEHTLDADLLVTTDYRSVLSEVVVSRFAASTSAVFPGFVRSPVGVMVGG